MLIAMSCAANAYNVVDLPESMTMADAMGVFSGADIERVTVSDVTDGEYVELSREQILDFYYAVQDITVHRRVDATPFRGIAVNVYTASDCVSYYMNSGVQIGLYGNDSYVCYKPEGADAEKLLYLDSLYHDSQRQGGAEFKPNTSKDFLKLPSAKWAQSFAKTAASRALLPYEFTNRYSDNITREQFCILLGNMIAVRDNYASLEMYMFDKGKPYLRNYFEDCSGVDDSVNILYALGIISGKDETHFDPNGTITREEAATLLCKAAEMYMWIGTSRELGYADTSSISPWARFFVTWATENSVMTGVTETEFAPQGAYTVEQAVATIVRLDNLLS